jgi:hypothetical protein
VDLGAFREAPYRMREGGERQRERQRERKAEREGEKGKERGREDKEERDRERGRGRKRQGEREIIPESSLGSPGFANSLIVKNDISF